MSLRTQKFAGWLAFAVYAAVSLLGHGGLHAISGDSCGHSHGHAHVAQVSDTPTDDHSCSHDHHGHHHHHDGDACHDHGTAESTDVSFSARPQLHDSDDCSVCHFSSAPVVVASAQNLVVPFVPLATLRDADDALLQPVVFGLHSIRGPPLRDC